MKVYMVEYLSSLLGDSNVLLFTDKTQARKEYDDLCKMELGSRDLINEAEDNEYIDKQENSLWISADVYGDCDVLIRFSEVEL